MQWFLTSFLFRSSTSRMQNFLFYNAAGQWCVTRECINVTMYGWLFKHSQTSIGVFLYCLNVMWQQSLVIRPGLILYQNTYCEWWSTLTTRAGTCLIFCYCFIVPWCSATCCLMQPQVRKICGSGRDVCVNFS